jgi:hypothetical protein
MSVVKDDYALPFFPLLEYDTRVDISLPNPFLSFTGAALDHVSLQVALHSVVAMKVKLFP